MISYTYKKPDTKPTVRWYVRWHDLKQEFLFKEIDDNGEIVAQGTVGIVDLPAPVRWHALEAKDRKFPESAYVLWKISTPLGKPLS